jgi:hypothetical protein
MSEPKNTSPLPVQIEVTGMSMPYMRGLLPGNGDTQGSEIPGPPGTTLRYEGAVEYRAADIPTVYQFVMAVASGVTAKLIADWLCDKFRGHAQKVTINRREIDLDDEGQVRRVVEEEIRIRPR